MFENEEWCEVEELPHYLVSTHGRVKHRDAVEARKVVVNDQGAVVLTLYGADGKTRYLRQMNRLVLIAFGEPSPHTSVNSVWHKDGDPLNCHISNLAWATRGEVLEWKEMHRSGQPRMRTPRVKNNRTGAVYANAYECGIAESRTESNVILRIEQQARSPFDDTARYRYLED